MKAQELRIGNLFIEETSNKIIEVIGLEKNRIIFSGMFLNEWQLKPISLTEEWLLKFGYIQIKGIHRTYSKTKYNDNTTIYNYRDYLHQQTGIKIEFVHQLQNLYFALTGEELMLKQ